MRPFHALFAEQQRSRLDCGRHSLAFETGAVCRFDRQPTNGRHRHNYFEVCLVLSGQGKFIHGDRTIALAEGDVFLAEPDVEHEIASRETRDLELVYFSYEIITGRAALGTRDEDRLLAAFLGARRLWAPGGALLARYAAWLPAERGAAGFGLGATRSQECLLLDLIGILVEPSAVPFAPAQAGGPAILQRALDYINGHLEDRLTPAGLAEAAGISPRQLRRLFREHAGGTVVGEINRRKMNAAANQLLMRIPVTEVAYRYGMEHPSHFTRTFKQVIGVPPREFMRRYSPLDRVRHTLRNESKSGVRARSRVAAGMTVR